MICPQCGGRGTVTFSDGGSFRLMEGRCPSCRGLGQVPFSREIQKPSGGEQKSNRGDGFGCAITTAVMLALSGIATIIILLLQ